MIPTKKLNQCLGIVHLKYSNGHEIWIIKHPVNKFRFYGTYVKPLKEGIRK